ncbi:MAG: hypothetical protein PHY45_11765 [Rhodocyclaceae bacterium]|nr:hypothetical protein [Rhodocyclaceae bacterium]
MIPASILAQNCAAIYDDANRQSWAKYWELDGVHIALAHYAEADVLVFRGSADAQDFMRDADAVPEWHPNLGFLHAGFAAGLDDVMAEVHSAVGERVAITGHSLGGARARILAAMRVIEGWPVHQLCVFGSPKPGFANVSRIIQKSGMAHSSYRNRNDPMPLMPGLLPLWEHPEDWIALDEHPDVNDFDPLRDHSMALYARGVAERAA